MFFLYRRFPKNPQGPSNGRVNEPILAGVFWGPPNDAIFEGSGFLGIYYICVYI